MSRRHRRGRQARAIDPVPCPCDDGRGLGWVEWCGQRMFVVDHTSAGFPIGVFEDEIDRDWIDDPDSRADEELS